MSYEETIELSFFGSKVLHPKTLAPLAAKGIEAWSLNSMNPSARGTRIGKGPFTNQDGADCVTGISCLKKTAMISVSGNGMKGKTGKPHFLCGVARGLFNAFNHAVVE